MGNSKNAQKRQHASARSESKKFFGDENSTPVAKPNIPTKPPRPRPIPRKQAAQDSHVVLHDASTERADANVWDGGVDTATAAALLSMSRRLRTQSLALNIQASEQFNSPSFLSEDPEIHDTEESVADEDDHGSAKSISTRTTIYHDHKHTRTSLQVKLRRAPRKCANMCSLATTPCLR